MFKPFGNEIHNLSLPLGIDDVLLPLLNNKGRTGVRSDLKLDRVRMLKLGRIMLKDAINQGEAGIRAHEKRTSWAEGEKIGHEAEQALEKFISLFALADEPHRKDRLLFHLHSFQQVTRIRKNNWSPIRGTGLRKAATSIFKAKGTIHWMTQCLNHYAQHQKPRQNVGSPEKREFAEVIMEGWAYLTGKVASPSNTTFCDLLATAWSDATAEESVQDWEHHIRLAVKKS